MPISQKYFEFPDVRHLDRMSWIPLRQVFERELQPPEVSISRLEEWTGISTAAVEIEHKTIAESMGWSDGLGANRHMSVVEGWGYCAADIFRRGSVPIGINLVVSQHVEQEYQDIWHLHPDLIVALKLVREGDTWFRPEEGWVEVVRLRRNESGSPTLLGSGPIDFDMRF